MAMPSSTGKLVYGIEETREAVRQPPAGRDWASFASSAIILDNGASSMRAGWSAEGAPRVVTENVIARYKDRKTNRNVLLAGHEAYADATSRASIKSPYEGDVLVNFDPMEGMLDYVFVKLGIPTETIQHPIVMTESLCTPRHSRTMMNELLFEGYGVPSVAYGVDSLFAFYGHSPSPTADGLVISSNTSSTHVIPVLDGQGILTSAKKLNWGGAQGADYMLKLMQLKYPTFPGRVNTFQAASMYRDHCYYASDYNAEIRALSDSTKLAASDRVVQFPYVHLLPEEKSTEDLERIAERKKESGRRLQEQAQRQRLEKMVRQEEELAAFAELKASKGTSRKADYDKRLKDAGFTSTEDLDAYCAKIEKSLQRARNKDLGIEEPDNKEPPTFPLVNVPDHTLNEEDLKEKRRQRLMKAGYDARIRAKAEKEHDRMVVEEARRRDEEARLTDPKGWLKSVRQEHGNAIEKIKERKKRKEQLSDRKSLAAQNRMKSIANLADDAQTGKKRKRAEKDDGFGQNDADWAVYREIGNADDSDDEEDEQEALRAVEARLLEHDPLFTLDHTAERQALRKHQLLNAFVRGLAPDDPLDTYDPESLEHNSQIHLNIERIRAPEVLWQPHMGGADQAGLGEIIEHVLRGFNSAERDRLTKNVFVTGGNTLLPNFDLRLHNALRPVLPSSSPLNIVRPYDVTHGAWQGMAKWAGSEEMTKSAVSRAEYFEFGADYFKVHRVGNAL